jgi:quercetin dioxygenase-like cupin family protein
MTDQSVTQRRRIEFFFDRECPEANPEKMPLEGIDEDIQAGMALIAEAEMPYSAGSTLREIFTMPGDNGMSLYHAWFRSGYVLPFHSHNTDCLYYVVAGELRMGARVLRKGDGFFIPKDMAYGYEVGPEGLEILEFRNTTHFNLKFAKNPLERWAKIVSTYNERGAIWEEELPPSQK